MNTGCEAQIFGVARPCEGQHGFSIARNLRGSLKPVGLAGRDATISVDFAGENRGRGVATAIALQLCFHFRIESFFRNRRVNCYFAP
jgi:hypothetical protein